MPSPHSAALAATAISLYSEGRSSLEIGATLGVSKAWVLRKVRAAGIIRTANAAFAISRTHGAKLRARGTDCMSWRGGRKITEDGYVAVLRREHPSADRNGYVLEHRLVAEQKIGRPLLPTEDAHHKNEVKTDNDPDNLEVLTHAVHMSIHARKRPRHSDGHFGTKGRNRRDANDN